MPTGALAPDEDQTPGGDPSRGRRGVREDSGNPVPVCQDRSGADRQTDASSADPRDGEAQGAEVPVGTPVSDRGQQSAAAEPASEAAARVSEEEAVPDGTRGRRWRHGMRGRRRMRHRLVNHPGLVIPAVKPIVIHRAARKQCDRERCRGLKKSSAFHGADP